MIQQGERVRERPCPSYSEQAHILKLKRSKAESETQEEAARHRCDALEAQVEAVVWCWVVYACNNNKLNTRF